MAATKRPSGNPFARKHPRAAYRSGLEGAISIALAAAGVAAQYEAIRVPYTVPAAKHTYRPDWVLPNGIVVEGKGLWTAEDRKKHALIKEQHPNLDLRMVFSNPNAKIAKGSATTYADVCRKLGLQYAKKEVPTSWLTEPLNASSAAVLKALGWAP